VVQAFRFVSLVVQASRLLALSKTLHEFSAGARQAGRLHHKGSLHHKSAFQALAALA